MNEATKIWLEEANNNKYSCEVLLSQQRPPYRIIAYLASMSAEMAIKACFTELMPYKEIPRIHRTIELLNDISKEIPVPLEIKQTAEKLIPNTVNNKYPDGEEIGEVEIHTIIKLSKEVYTWALDRIHEHEQLNSKARHPSQGLEPKAPSMSTQGRSPEK